MDPALFDEFRAAINQDDPAAIVRLGEQLIEEDCDVAAVFSTTALAHEERGNTDRSFELLHRALELKPCTRRRLDIAKFHLRRGQSEPALQSTLRAIQLDPNGEDCAEILNHLCLDLLESDERVIRILLQAIEYGCLDQDCLSTLACKSFLNPDLAPPGAVARLSSLLDTMESTFDNPWLIATLSVMYKERDDWENYERFACRAIQAADQQQTRDALCEIFSDVDPDSF